MAIESLLYKGFLYKSTIFQKESIRETSGGVVSDLKCNVTIIFLASPEPCRCLNRLPLQCQLLAPFLFLQPCHPALIGRTQSLTPQSFRTPLTASFLTLHYNKCIILINKINFNAFIILFHFYKELV